MRRREGFDEVAELYDKARPRYPDALVRDLIASADLRAGRRVLEIGCGTGQLTTALAPSGVSLVAVELGPNLAAIARRNLSGFPHVEIRNADFETWPVPAESFDLVVAATAFHWLDPSTRIERCACALRPGGALAIIETHWGVGVDRDEFSVASTACYRRWDPNHDPGYLLPTLSDLPTAREDLAASDRFERVALARYSAEHRYSADEYCDLLRTFSDVIGFAEENRAGFLACMRTLIDSRFGGQVLRWSTYDLWTARAAT